MNKNLFIISGIGAELTIKIYKSIIDQSSSGNIIDFVFCIHQHIDKFHALIEHASLTLLGVSLIIEKNQYYEIFYLRYGKGRE